MTVSATQPAKLIRGLSNTRHDKLAWLVLNALKDDTEWIGLEEQDVEVKDVSGYGGSKTFRVSAKQTAQSMHDAPIVAVHSHVGIPETEHRPHYRARETAAASAFAAAGLTTARKCHGNDWYVGEWQGIGNPEFVTEADYERFGALLARVHSIYTLWFDEHREELIARIPKLAGVRHGSHIWPLATRGYHADDMCQNFTTGPFDTNDGIDNFMAYANLPAAMLPSHPVAQRIVTTHGDLHSKNTLDLGDGQLACVDLEFTTVSSACYDLKYSMPSESMHKRAFLRGYVKELGEPDTDIEALLLDIEVSSWLVMHQGLMLAMFDIHHVTAAQLHKLLTACEQFASEARVPGALRDAILNDGASAALKGYAAISNLLLDAMAESQCYQQLQQQLEEALQVTQSPEPAMEEGQIQWIRPSNDNSLAVQVKPGTQMLQLAVFDSSCVNQQWRMAADLIQHVESGLYLDDDVRYTFNHRGAPWEAASALRVKPRELGCEAQRWVVEGEMIRHCIDGRILDVNFWQLRAGCGVNLSTAHGTCFGSSWEIQDMTNEHPAAGELHHIGTSTGPEVAHEQKTWKWYQAQAAEKGGRLPTVFELKAASVHRQMDWGHCYDIVPVAVT